MVGLASDDDVVDGCLVSARPAFLRNSASVAVHLDSRPAADTDTADDVAGDDVTVSAVADISVFEDALRAACSLSDDVIKSGGLTSLPVARR